MYPSAVEEVVLRATDAREGLLIFVVFDSQMRSLPEADQKPAGVDSTARHGASFGRPIGRAAL
ncbi:hypothetical protein [Mesorhizobium sp. ANAO-SY3R2]|uniref:hypothetical protein n=1 Tax=Mesorhizobium sp. ANAO-SY3R2 TaxID=3166644 RepID=UPI003670193E